MKRVPPFIFLAGGILLVTAAIFVLSDSGILNSAAAEPEWAHGVSVNGDVKTDDAKKIRQQVFENVEPYRGMEYDSVIMNMTHIDGTIRVRVTGTSSDAVLPDIFEFVYYPDKAELVLTGYVLEAIPQDEAGRMVFAAETNETIAPLLRSANMVSKPTVRRILPETSKKFYLPKTLISVTWSGQQYSVSALIDPDLGIVVRRWSSGEQEGNRSSQNAVAPRAMSR